MYAVVNTGGKQAKVEVGSVIAVDKLKAKVGDTVSLPVLMIADGEKVLAKPAEIAGAGVTAQVLEHFLGEKVVVFKFKKRKGYKRTKGHRQQLTSVVILDIAMEGAAKAKAAPKAEKPKAEKPKVEKAVEPKAEKVVEVKAEAAPKAEKPKAEKPKAEKPKAEKAAEPKAAPKPKAEKADAPKAAADAAQCAAVKSDGTQCANKAKEGSKYCGVHAKKLEG